MTDGVGDTRNQMRGDLKLSDYAHAQWHKQPPRTSSTLATCIFPKDTNYKTAMHIHYELRFLEYAAVREIVPSLSGASVVLIICTAMMVQKSRKATTPIDRTVDGEKS